MKKLYPNHDLIWICSNCGKENREPMHSDPLAHFVSMICQFCEKEEEGCACNTGRIIPHSINESARQLGRLSAAARKLKGYSSEYYRQLANKRWKK